MRFFKYKTTTEDTLLNELNNITGVIQSTHDTRVTVNLEVVSHKVNEKEDDKNFSGVVSYKADTEYGGGPGYFDAEFSVSDGRLETTVHDVQWESILDITTIDAETDVEYGDGELDSDDDWE